MNNNNEKTLEEKIKGMIGDPQQNAVVNAQEENSENEENSETEVVITEEVEEIDSDTETERIEMEPLDESIYDIELAGAINLKGTKEQASQNIEVKYFDNEVKGQDIIVKPNFLVYLQKIIISGGKFCETVSILRFFLIFVICLNLCALDEIFNPCQGSEPKIKYNKRYDKDSKSSLRLCSTPLIALIEQKRGVPTICFVTENLT